MFDVAVIGDPAGAAVAPGFGRAPDRLSARWLLALAAQPVRDVGALVTGSSSPSIPPYRPARPPERPRETRG